MTYADHLNNREERILFRNFEAESDNYATYELLDKWDINVIIALNPINSGNRKLLSLWIRTASPFAPEGMRWFIGGVAAKTAKENEEAYGGRACQQPHFASLWTGKLQSSRQKFFATVAAFNIHFDAQLAELKTTGLFDFQGVFGVSAVA
ncbi:hypothetical protein [Desulforamulus aeronauticus]|uniref:hypothetical protein n=1 Tax=Desulforamulus aeronauticus TaxID=53343 RepID=UPI0009340ACD|nr:hypothetical protein [Desulforamulus aeronauticus]